MDSSTNSSSSISGISAGVSLSELFDKLNQAFGKKAWLTWEPETILLETGSLEPILYEKIVTLQIMALVGVNSALSRPEFLIWSTMVCNGQSADFESVYLPTSLELAWLITQAKKIAAKTDQSFKASPELIQVVAYLLTEDGYSKPLEPFEFVPEELLHAGQTEADTKMKQKAIQAYLTHMESTHG